jgi:hypothetical protein
VNLSRGGLVLYAAAMAALGALLVSGHFVFVWAPVPRGVPGGSVIEHAAGAVLLAAAIGLVSWQRARAAAAATATAIFAGWLVLLQAPRLAVAPSRDVLWSGAAQLVAIAAGAWILCARASARSERSVRIARVLYALVLPVMGVHHFLDVAATAEAVPAWLPFRAAWGVLTGVAHIAAGVAILVGSGEASTGNARVQRLARLAAMLEAIMISGFVLLIHVPGVMGAPSDGLQWSMLADAALIGGAAWVVAGSFTSAGSIAPRSRS